MDSQTSEPQNQGKWYSKKRFVIPLGLAAVLFISQLGGGSEPTTTLVPASGRVQGIQTQETTTLPKLNPILEQNLGVPAEETKTTPKLTPAPQVQKPQPVQVAPKATTPSSGLSNDNYYTNVDGNKVHSPAYSDTIPAGASAKCKDGTYSFSQNRRGTCSGHGGVSVWY